MEIHIRKLDQWELPGFRSYLLPETTVRLERGDPKVFALGAVWEKHSCGAIAAYLREDGTELTDFFVDSAVRRRGIGKYLLDSLLASLDDMGRSRIEADYVLRDADLLAMDILLTSRGFCRPWTRSKVYAIPAEKFLDDRMLGRAFSSRYRTVEGIQSLGKVPEGMLLELEQTVPGPMRWSTVKDQADPDLSAVMVRGGKAVAYQLMGEAQDGVVLLSIVSGPGSRPADFLLLLREVLNRSWYRHGSEFTVYLSALSSQSDRLTVRLTEGRSVVYEEHVCIREHPVWQTAEKEDSI